MIYYCNICNSTKFVDFNNRTKSMCGKCQSLERHRLMWILIKHMLENNNQLSILHLAPEKCIGSKISNYSYKNYYATDVNPVDYNPGCLRMSLDDCLRIFPANYFDLIIHNHVLEHVEGSYIDHTLGLISLLKNTGTMLFTIPRNLANREIIESKYADHDDEYRKKIFGDKDHIKKFNHEAFSFLNLYGEFTCSWFSNEIRQILNAPAVSSNTLFSEIYNFKKINPTN